MKRFGNSILLVLATCMLSACGANLRIDAESVSVCFKVCSDVFSKASVEGHEGDVASLDLLAFRSTDGVLEKHVRAVVGTDYSASAPKVVTDFVDGNSVNWYIVANAPSDAFDGITTLMGFLSSYTGLDDSSASSLVMYGSGSLTPDHSVSDPVDVYLSRYCCKVSLGNVKVTWMDNLSPGTDIRVAKVVLVNVCGQTAYSGTPVDNGVWYNKMTVDGSLPTLLADMTVKDCTIAVPSSDPLAVNASLYGMPNPVSNGVNSKTNPVWSPRNTRLALLLTVNGDENWYPIDLPAMSCNKHYMVTNLEIRGPGSTGPDMPVTRDEITFEIEVTAWGEDTVEAVFANIP